MTKRTLAQLLAGIGLSVALAGQAMAKAVDIDVPMDQVSSATSIESAERSDNGSFQVAVVTIEYLVLGTVVGLGDEPTMPQDLRAAPAGNVQPDVGVPHTAIPTLPALTEQPRPKTPPRPQRLSTSPNWPAR